MDVAAHNAMTFTLTSATKAQMMAGWLALAVNSPFKVHLYTVYKSDNPCDTNEIDLPNPVEWMLTRITIALPVKRWR